MLFANSGAIPVVFTQSDNKQHTHYKLLVLIWEHFQVSITDILYLRWLNQGKVKFTDMADEIKW